MTKRIKLRTLFIGGLITLLFLVLVGRIYFVQVVHADFWLGKARETWATSETIRAERGKIMDREGNILAMDAMAYTVSINPKVIHSLGIQQDIIMGLNSLLGKSIDGLQEDVNAKRENGEYVVNREIRNEGWKIDKELADQVLVLRDELKKKTEQKDVGLYLREEQKRYYPKNAMASHLIGYVDKENKPVYGLESYYGDILAGEDGYIKYEKDGKRVQLADGEVDYKAAVDGKNLTLTINTEIQSYVEEAIKEAYEKHNPKSITAIAADPNTMEILGMASYPNYNPNEYWTASPEAFTNHAVKQLIEPGSTFKIVTLAGAVEEGLFNPEETYKSGSIRVLGDTLNDHRRGGWGEITFLDGLKYSSNVAFVKLGYERMGADKLRQYIYDFGFGQRTNIQQPGELTGSINFRYPVEVATATYGQGRVQVTPIQQVAAVAAIANGGKLLQPQLVKKIEDPMTKETETIQPKVIRQVISEKTAKLTAEYLEMVVSDREIGTGRNAYIDGYRVAGKTGTAQKVVNGDYAKDKFIVSFIGFAPVDDPKVVVYVVVDEPDDPYAGGGAVAAPIFKKIVHQSLRQLGVLPVASEEMMAENESMRKRTVTIPNITELKVSQAQNELKQRALEYEVVGKGTVVLQQIPAADTLAIANQRVYLITEERKQLAIPDMLGLPLRDALQVCTLLDMRCVTEGEGYVTSQTQVKQGGETVLRILLHPPGVVPDELPEQTDPDQETEEAEQDEIPEHADEPEVEPSP